MKVSVIINKHLAQVMLMDGDEVLLNTSHHLSEVDALLTKCHEIELTKEAEKEMDKISYSKPYKVYAYTGEIQKSPAKKAVKAPAKKSATGKKSK